MPVYAVIRTQERILGMTGYINPFLWDRLDILKNPSPSLGSAVGAPLGKSPFMPCSYFTYQTGSLVFALSASQLP